MSRAGAARFVVGQPLIKTRAHAYGGGTTVVEFVADHRYGEHATNIGAKRAYMEVLDPDLRGAEDDHIRRHFDAQSRNLGLAKILRVVPT